MTRLVAVSKSEMVYQRVRDRILTGTYGAGYRLVLDKLAREFEVSPVPVREAIRRLEAEGLVTFTRNVGAEVNGVNERDYTDAMQTLAFLEGAATALAAPRISAEQVAEATEVNEQMRHLHQGDFDPVRFTALNERFHRVLCGACPNRHLLDLVDREWQRMAMIRLSSFIRLSSRPAVSIAEHDNLLHLINSGAPAADVEHAARAHKLRTLEEFLTRQGADT